METHYPDLFDFIVLRREEHGGFLFNPYLYSELFLDEKDFRVLELCNGRLTIEEVKTRISEEFELIEDTSASIVRQSFEKGNEYFAINWRTAKKEGSFCSAPAGQIYKSSTTEFYPDYYSAPTSVIFEVTRECNLSCRHCLVSAGKTLADELSLDEIFNVLDQLKQMKVFVVNFGGGEPFMRKDFHEILKYASSANLGIIISTNGYFVNDSILDKLDDIKAFSVQISVDGLKDTHDRFRGRQGSFLRAVSALKKFSERGYHTTMSTMIMKDTVHEMNSIIDLCISNKISMLKLSSFMPAGRGESNAANMALSKSEMKQFAMMMQEQKQIHSQDLLIDDKATYHFLCGASSYTGDDDFSQPGYRIGCSAARTTLDIAPDGTVYACPFLTHFPIGNLKKEKLIDIWNDSHFLKILRDMNSLKLKGKCSNCHLIPSLCQGGCRAAAYLYSGDLFDEDPFCWKS